jgi:hypothetical protein
MAEMLEILTVFLETVITVFLTLSIIYFNGGVLLNLIRREQDLYEISPAVFFLLGLTPLALASLIGTSFQTCINSFSLLLTTEIIILSFFTITFIKNRKIVTYLQPRLLNKYQNSILLTLIWCGVFSLWVILSFQPLIPSGFDQVLVNSNPDMWFYLRRYAAYLGENINFDGHEACYYLLISPKKLSSLIGSLVINWFPESNRGIIIIKGLFGASLFLSLFGHWADFNKNKFGIIWAIFSPQIYWLILSSYLSNTLFIIVVILALRSAKNLSLATESKSLELRMLALGLVICLYSFYFAGIPLAILLFVFTIFIYSFIPNNLSQILKDQLLLMLIIGLGITALFLLFPEQFYLDEVKIITDPLFKHSKNFVPLNPWSLLQERPKPMGENKDFGVWFNLALGFIIAFFMTFKISTVLAKINDSLNKRDLISALAGIIFYLCYLFAYLSLEHTYRLMKIAISFMYPLAIFGLFPLLKWLRYDWLSNKSKFLKFLVTVFVVLHIILHIYETFKLHASPTGQYKIAQEIARDTSSITVIRCPSPDIGRRYEVLMGFRLARKYSKIPVYVIADSADTAKVNEDTKLIQGVIVPVRRDLDVCRYEVK